MLLPALGNDARHCQMLAGGTRESPLIFDKRALAHLIMLMLFILFLQPEACLPLSAADPIVPQTASRQL